MEHPGSPARDAFEPFLTAGSGAGWMRLAGGRMLLHPGHLAPGVFVIVEGTVQSIDAAGASRHVPAPCVVPALGEWDAPSACAWRLATDAEALFVPRSRLVAHGLYRDAFERAVMKTIGRRAGTDEETR